EGVETAIRANGFAYGVPRRWRASDSRHQTRKLVWRIRHLCDAREIDPGKEVQKIERSVGRSFWQDHRHDWERRIAGLADNRKLAFVLLGVAKPAWPDQNDHRLGCVDGLFQRADPG